MAVTFTGTHTGKTYVAGQSYVTGGGRVKTANSDGTFTDVKTGRSTVGSSQDPTVTWGSTSSGSNRDSGSGAGTGRATSGRNVGDGAGGGKVVVNGPGNPGAGPGNPGAVIRPSGSQYLGGGLLSSQPKGANIVPGWTQGAPQRVTQLFINGVAVPRNAGTSDMEDAETIFGEGDSPLSPGWLPAWSVAIDQYDYALSKTWAWQQVEGFRQDNAQRVRDWEKAADQNLESGFADFSEAYGTATGGWQ